MEALEFWHYFVTFVCTAGGCYTGIYLGRKEGVIRTMTFLERNSKNGIVKLRIRGDDFEFVE